MDTLHAVLRSIRHETKAETAIRRDPLNVFREFLDHLERASRRRGPAPRGAKPAKTRRGRR